jgi:hypothetical protein
VGAVEKAKLPKVGTALTVRAEAVAKHSQTEMLILSRGHHIQRILIFFDNPKQRLFTNRSFGLTT